MKSIRNTLREARAAFWEGFWDQSAGPKNWKEFWDQCKTYYKEGRTTGKKLFR